MTTLVCPVTCGYPTLSDRDVDFIASWKCDEVKVSPYKEKRDRSLKQNSYLWGVVYTMIAAETGHTTEELHEFFKMLLLDRKFMQVGKEEFMIPKSTTTLSTEEFSKYVEQVRAFAGTELGITIPDPNE